MSRRVWQIICIAITVGITLFIFAHSASPAADSSGASRGVYATVCRIFEFFGGEFPLTHKEFRKLAHFIEFSALGFMLVMTTRSFTARVAKNLCAPLFAGLMVSVIDETIQLYYPGRSGEVRDVLIDFSGVLFGVILALIVLRITKKKSA